MEERPVIGFIEQIVLEDQTIPSKIDTGADTSSIDISLAAELQLGPVVQKTKITSSHGKTRRAVISLTFDLAGKQVTGFFNLADRHNLKYKVLIGKNILKEGFIIDPRKE